MLIQSGTFFWKNLNFEDGNAEGFEEKRRVCRSEDKRFEKWGKPSVEREDKYWTEFGVGPLPSIPFFFTINF